MKRLIYLTTAFLLLLMAHGTRGQGLNGPIAKAFRLGDSAPLKGCLKSQVELNIGNQKARLNEAEAIKKLSQFFSSNPVTGFTIIHKGSSKGGLNYTIGQYSSAQATYRIYLLVKEENGRAFIDMIDIGEE